MRSLDGLRAGRVIPGKAQIIQRHSCFAGKEGSNDPQLLHVRRCGGLLELSQRRLVALFVLRKLQEAAHGGLVFVHRLVIVAQACRVFLRE